MKILLISQYFFPETGATSNRIYSLAKYFHNQGADVRIIAEKPNHPGGVFFEGYEDRLFLDTTYKKIPVTYTWVKTKPDKGFVDRIFFYVSFMIMAVVAAWKKRDYYDVVIASSPPLFVGISGWLAAKINRSKFIFDVRDIWPDVAVAMGELTNETAIKVAEGIEKFLYRKANLITTVTASFQNSIQQKGFSSSKIEVVANGTDPDLFKTHVKVDKLRKNLNLPSSFLIGYIGNHGLAQGLDHVIEAAAELNRMGNYNVNFIMVGDGPRKKQLQQLAEQKKLKNIKFIDRVPLVDAVKYMNSMDALLVPLANDPIYSQFIPSKLFDSMAAEKPILLSVNGEARKILDKAEAGIYYQAENSEELTQKIVYLYNHSKEGAKMGSSGRKFVNEYYTREKQAEKMNSCIQKLIS